MFVCGLSRTYYNKESKKHNKGARKRFFCYQYCLETVNYKTGKPGIIKKRISFYRFLYYQITFIFGFKAKLKHHVYCEYCKRYCDYVINFWDKDIECPYC